VEEKEEEVEERRGEGCTLIVLGVHDSKDAHEARVQEEVVQTRQRLESRGVPIGCDDK